MAPDSPRPLLYYCSSLHQPKETVTQEDVGQAVGLKGQSGAEALAVRRDDGRLADKGPHDVGVVF